MSEPGVVAARALSDFTADLLPRLTADDWAADAACHGWRVHDVVTHMGFFFNFISDPDLVFPDNPSGQSERLNDAAVNERADWSTTRVIDYYRQQQAAGMSTLEALQGPELRDNALEMLDLGTYRMSQLADAVAFDHLVHLTYDLAAPHGPVATRALDTAAVIDPAIDWMIAGLPPMSGADVARVIDGPIGIALTGETTRSFVLSARHDTVTVTETDALPDDVATCEASAFLGWATRRTAWRSAVTVTGDRRRVSRALDAINII